MEMVSPSSVSSSSRGDSAPRGHLLPSSSSFTTLYGHRPCTSNRRVKRRMEPSHRAAKEMQKMREDQERWQRQMNIAQPVNLGLNINLVVPPQVLVPHQQQGVAHPQQGFPLHQQVQQGVAPQHQAFPPHQQYLAPPHQGFVPQGYPHQQFIPHQQGYVNHGYVYDPHQQAYIPHGYGVPPHHQQVFSHHHHQQQGYIPQPHHGGFVPQPDDDGYDGFVPQDPGTFEHAQPRANVYHQPAAQQQTAGGQQANGQANGQPEGRIRRRLPDLPKGVPVLPYFPRTREPPMNPPSPPRQEKELTKIGLYTFHEKLGDGMFGAVRRATHDVTKDQVAIKCIEKSKLLPSRGSLIRVYREIELQKKMNHPFVLDVYQVMETKTHIYLVTELCPGGELFHLIRRQGRLPEPHARVYFSQLVSAVQYLHERGVVHRDIKAENLLLDEFGNLKVADFGFANFVPPDLLMQTYCGSPQYAAPEMFESTSYNGHAVDVWCMGVVLYVCLVGCTPFEGKEFAEIRRKVIGKEIEFPCYLSNEANHLLGMMLQRRVNERATLDEVAAHVWLTCDGLPLYIMNSLLTYNFFLETTPKRLMQDCLTGLGITERQMRERVDRFDNVDGMHELLKKDYRMRRLRKVWESRLMTRVFIAAHALKSQGTVMAVLPVVLPIKAAPIKEILAARNQEIQEAEENNEEWSLYLPHPEEYPYHEFQEEQRKEAEESERERIAQLMEAEMQGSSTEFNPADYAALSVETDEGALGSSEGPGQEPRPVAAFPPAPEVARSTEIADFIAAQAAQPAGSQQGTWPSALLALAANLNQVPLDLRRLPSDVCHRIAALDLIQKRRGGAPLQAPMAKRPSLPSLFEQNILRRTTVRLGDPPKKSERKSFFEMMRLKKKKVAEQSGQSTSGTNWAQPPPALPEGGSFDDADEGKPDEGKPAPEN